MRRRSGPIALVAATAALALLPLLRPPAFYESFLYLTFLWIALATSWNILSGYSGYFSFGHGAFYGAGVYTTAALAARFEVPFVWTLPAAGLVAALLGFAVGAVVFRVRRLRGELFALLTLAVTFVLATVVLNTPIDGGPGVFLSGVAVPKVYGTTASTIYLFGLGAAAAAVAAAWAVQHSRLGLALFAISDDEDAAQVMGVPAYRAKLAALCISCFLAGVAGGIHALFVTYVTVAETFSITVPLFVILMSVVGGARHWLGPTLGAVFITALTYAFVGGEWAVPGRAVIGLILILVILFLPHGAMGFAARRAHRRPPRLVAASAGANPRRLAVGSGPRDAVLLRCNDVHLTFRGVRALAGVNLDVRAGEILGLVGPNGSGKSTLVNTISGYYRPDTGRILLGQTDLAATAAHRIARLGVARTFQIPRPFPRLTVLDNVAVAALFGGGRLDWVAAQREARYWLDFVGLAKHALAPPLELNLHQRKFLELARALASVPQLVLLDEVLSGLTPAEVTNALALIREINARGATIVFIEHNMRAVLALTHRLVVLNHGQVIAEGAPHSVVRQPAVVTAYLGTAHA